VCIYVLFHHVAFSTSQQSWISLSSIKPLKRQKVPCPENLFLRKSQRYKGTMSHCVDIQHLFFDTSSTYYDYYWQNHDDSNDVNKTLSSVKLLAINILCYFVIKEVNDSLGNKSQAGLKTSCSKWMDITPLCIHSSLMNCSLKSFFFVSVTN